MSLRHRSLSAAKVQITMFDSFLMQLADAALSFLRLSSMSMEEMSLIAIPPSVIIASLHPCLAYTAHEIENKPTSSCSYIAFRSAWHHLCCFAELDDGSVLFSFGEKTQAKAASATAPSAVSRKDHNKSTSTIRQQTDQGAPQASQEQSKPAEDEQTDSQSSSKQKLANSSMHSLQQPVLTALQRIAALKAKQAAAPAIDPKIIAKYTRLAVTPNLPVSGSTGPSSSSFDASQSVSSVPSQRPSSPAVTIANPSSSSFDGSKAVSQAPSQKPVSAKPAIDPKTIAKYSRQAVIPDLPASGSPFSSSSFNADKSVSSVSSQRPFSVPAVAIGSQSSSKVDSSKPVSQAPSQKPGSTKPAIDPKIIAKYSRRAVTPDLPASASHPRSSSLNAGESASKASMQPPSPPAIALTSPSSSEADASESLSKASTQRPRSPAVASTRPSSSSADASKSMTQAPSQRSSSLKPAIDPEIIAKYSRQAVTPDLPASRSEGAEPDRRPSSADTSDEEGSSSEAASERLGDMTPQQLQGLKVSSHPVAWHFCIALQSVECLSNPHKCLFCTLLEMAWRTFISCVVLAIDTMTWYAMFPDHALWLRC